MDLETKNYIDQKINSLKDFSQRVNKDLPTDDLNVVNRKYIVRKFYGGAVKSDGTALTPFPTGWSVSKPAGSGTYRVTHNLNLNNKYVVVTTPLAIVVGTTQTLDVNSFDIYFYDSASKANTDTNWNFILMTNQ